MICVPTAHGGENHEHESFSASQRFPQKMRQQPSAPIPRQCEIGDMIYTSGQVALDPATGQLVEGGIREQTVRVLENLKAVLAAGRQRSATRGQDDRLSQEHE